MPFTTTDRDNIRDIFSYPWSYNDCITSLLDSAFSEHGETVVTAVQGYVTSIQTLQSSLDTAIQENAGVESVWIYGQSRIDRQPGSESQGIATRIGDLKNKIRLAIDPYGQLYSQSQTTLLRS